jgi:cytosine/uracil/thiamine/allantoin permease
MALHLFRPHEPVIGSSPPVGTWTRIKRTEKAGYLLNWIAGLLNRHHIRRVLCMVLLLAGVVVQLVCIAMAAYLIDLAVSLMELWAELARKHLEITL